MDDRCRFLLGKLYGKVSEEESSPGGVQRVGGSQDSPELAGRRTPKSAGSCLQSTVPTGTRASPDPVEEGGPSTAAPGGEGRLRGRGPRVQELRVSPSSLPTFLNSSLLLVLPSKSSPFSFSCPSLLLLYLPPLLSSPPSCCHPPFSPFSSPHQLTKKLGSSVLRVQQSPS